MECQVLEKVSLHSLQSFQLFQNNLYIDEFLLLFQTEVLLFEGMFLHTQD